MQLQGTPQAQLSFLRIAGANQDVQRCTMGFEKIGGDLASVSLPLILVTFQPPAGQVGIVREERFHARLIG